jgi:hypothetical protein
MVQTEVPDQSSEELKQHFQDILEGFGQPVMKKIEGIVVESQATPHLLEQPTDDHLPTEPADHLKQFNKKIEYGTEKQLKTIKGICNNNPAELDKVASNHGVQRIENMSKKDCWKFINENKNKN